MDTRSQMPVGTVVRITKGYLSGQLGVIHAHPGIANPGEPLVKLTDDTLLFNMYDAMEAVNISEEVSALERKIRDNKATLDSDMIRLLGESGAGMIQSEIIKLNKDLEYLQAQLRAAQLRAAHPQPRAAQAQQKVNPIKTINIILLDYTEIQYSYNTRTASIEDIYLKIKSLAKEGSRYYHEYRDGNFHIKLPGQPTIFIDNKNPNPIFLENIPDLNDNSNIELIIGPRPSRGGVLYGKLKYKKRINTKKRRNTKKSINTKKRRNIKNVY